ncbi:MAG: HDOD domain-containing protein [Steroidobacteraceae bacterium]
MAMQQVEAMGTAVALSNEQALIADALQQDLDAESVEILGYPEIAMRIHRALAKEHINTNEIVRQVATEPVLAARILQIANSAALNPRGESIVDLRTAVSRVGVNLLRGAVAAHAMRQLRSNKELVAVRGNIRDVWQKSVVVAAISDAIARHVGGINPDTALLAGLLHNVGELYVLVKCAKHPEVILDKTAYGTFVSNYGAPLSVKLLQGWKIPDSLVEAVQQHVDLGRSVVGSVPSLADVLALAVTINTYSQDVEQLDLALATMPVLQRFKFEAGYCRALVCHSESSIGEIIDALGM